MKIKTIIVTSNSSWNIYNFRLPLIIKLRNLGHHVIIASLKDEFTDRLIDMDFEFVALKELQPLNKGIFNNIKLLLEYHRLFKKTSPDIILSFTVKPNIFSGLASRFKDISFYPTLTGLGSLFIINQQPTFGLKTLYKSALKKAKMVIFHNEDDRDELVNYEYLRKNQTQIIPGSGVDENKFAYSPITQFRPIRFLCVSRLINEKGVDVFIEASKKFILKYPKLNVHFRLLGSINPLDPRSISEESLTEWSNLDHCEYGGFIENINDEIGASTVFVLPSMREGMPRAVLESMSVGRPVITTDVPGCRQVMNGNGIIIPSRDTSSLMEAMYKMTTMSTNELNEMGKRGRQLIEEKYNVKSIVNMYKDVLDM